MEHFVYFSFREENIACLTTNQRAQFSTQAAARWLDLRLRMLGVAIVGSIAFIAVIQHHFMGIDAGVHGCWQALVGMKINGGYWITLKGRR